MGKKSAKGKLKKEKRKEELEKEKARRAIIQEAGKIDNDLLEPLAPFCKFQRNGLNLSLQHVHQSKLSTEEKEWIFTLVKSTMQTLYDDAGPDWGWRDNDKRSELFHDEAHFILVKDVSTDGKSVPVAYANFRFEIEDDYETLYLYEFQVDKSVGRKGLGKFLMQVLEMVAIKNKIKFVMLTCFKENVSALNFYEKLKYKHDYNSPDVADPLNSDDYSYHILSKCLDKELEKKLQEEAG